VTDTLDRIIYSKPPTASNGTKPGETLIFSGSLTADDAAQWRVLVTLSPYEGVSGWASQAVGIFPGPGRNFLLASTYHDTNAQQSEVVLIPRKVLQQAAGNIDPLIALVTDAPQNGTLPAGTKAAPLDMPALLPLSFESRLDTLRALLRDVGSIEHALRLLGAALSESHLLIDGYPSEIHARVALVQGLMTLLPAQARAELTFATHISNGNAPGVRVAFGDSQSKTNRQIANVQAGQLPDESDMPYVALLRELWQGDDAAFLQALDELEPLADALLPGSDLSDGLNRLADQAQINQRVQQGEEIDPETLKATLTADLPLPPPLTRRYYELLLEHALDARDTEAALLVALKMDEDPQLDRALNEVLVQHLETQPDDVYVFVRTRLNDAMEADTRWIERLHAAALVSLQVAISDADSETIMNWLRLIAREPADYGLSSILRDGILATQERARSDGDLARYLITLTIKHAPDILDTLLDDEDLLAVLPNNLGMVLRDHTGDPLYTLQNRGPELFLVAIARSAQAQVASVFTTEVIDQLWKLYTTGQNFHIPSHYLPTSIVEMLTTTGAAWLSNDTLKHLATHILADARDDLFIQFAAHLAEYDALVPLLGSALHESQRSIDDMITLVNNLTTASYLDQQAVVEIYAELLEHREWRQIALPLVEQLARMLQQNATLKLDSEILWRLLDVAMPARSEMVAKVAAQQLFNDIERKDDDHTSDSDANLVESLLRLHDSLQWSQQARSTMLKWWRDFVREQPLARLARLDKLLENKKTVADCRAVVQTSLAFRRMLNNRDMGEFADAVNVVYSVLADMAQSFDPSPKQATSFDEETVRAELDHRREILTDQEWHILAKNFRELASLIGIMGDHRSRASLVRQNVDRQLLSGEQQPESAVDAMKWMAGYLEGIQARDDENEE
jgi:hypothetical protein